MWRQQTIKRTQPTIFFSIQSRWCKVKRLVGGLVVDGLVVGGATHTREGWGCWLMQGRWVGSATTDTSVVVVNGWWVVWLILVQGKWVGATTDTMGWVGGAQRFFKGSLSDLFWRSLSENWESLSKCPILWFRGRPWWMQLLFWWLYIKKCTQKNMNILVILHAHMSYTLMCSMLVQLLLVQYWLDTLMNLLGGGGWGGDWYKGGGWAPQQMIQGWWC